MILLKKSEGHEKNLLTFHYRDKAIVFVNILSEKELRNVKSLLAEHETPPMCPLYPKYPFFFEGLYMGSHMCSNVRKSTN